MINQEILTIVVRESNCIDSPLEKKGCRQFVDDASLKSSETSFLPMVL